jgi:PKD repeat protein
MRRPTAISLVLLLVLASFTFVSAPAAAAWPPPSADAGSDQTVTQGDSVTLDGSNSFDLNGDKLTFWWDLDNSNGSDSRDATGSVVTVKYADSGIYTATLHVDDGDFEDTDTVRTTVIPSETDNIPPVAIIVQPLPGVYNVSEPIQFEGQAYDADGDQLTAKWDFGDDKTSNQPIVKHTYTNEGPKYITFTVRDGKANDTARMLIMIGESTTPESNRRPDAIFNATPRNVTVGQLVTFDASESEDPDGDSLEYEWDFNTEGLPETDATGMIVTHRYNSTGTYDVTLQVRDGKQGGWDYAQDTITVREEANDPPVANAGNDAEIQVGVSVTFRGTATDPDGDNITMYMWDFGDGSNWESNVTGRTNHTYRNPGTYTATFTVEDERGERGSDSRIITVNPPPDMPPNAYAGEDMTVMQGETARFQGAGTDDFGIAKYEWDFNSDNIWDYESDRNGDTTWVYPDPGIYTAILRVTDDPRPGAPGSGQTDEDSLLVTVKQNQPPEAKILVTTLFVQAGELVSFTSDSDDPEGAKLDYAWDLDGDGATDSNVANPRFTYHKEGNYQVTLTVTDDFGQSDSASITIQVSQSYAVEIEITSPIRDLDPGDQWEFRATVTNKGNGDDQFRITVGGLNNNWATLDRSVVNLNASEKQTITVTVKVPTAALSTDEALLSVTAASNFGSASESATIEVYVKQHFSVAATMDEDSISIKKGESREDFATITITNNGNGPDTFRISFSGDIAGYLRTSTPKVDLPPGASRDVKVSIDVADSVASGKASGTVIVASTKSVAKEQMEFVITIEGGDSGGSPFELNLYMMVAIVVAIAVVLVVLGASSSKKKGKVNGGTH